MGRANVEISTRAASTRGRQAELLGIASGCQNRCLLVAIMTIKLPSAADCFQSRPAVEPAFKHRQLKLRRHCSRFISAFHYHSNGRFISGARVYPRFIFRLYTFNLRRRPDGQPIADPSANIDSIRRNVIYHHGWPRILLNLATSSQRGRKWKPSKPLFLNRHVEP